MELETKKIVETPEVRFFENEFWEDRSDFSASDSDTDSDSDSEDNDKPIGRVQRKNQDQTPRKIKI